MKYKTLIKEIGYVSSKDKLILNSCLKNWFSDPKDLNLTDWRMIYPFKFSAWYHLFYKNENTKTWAAIIDKWIVGIVSLKLNKKGGDAQIFHLYVDKIYRRKYIGKSLVQTIINFSVKNKISKLSVLIRAENTNALSLFKKLGFISSEEREKQVKLIKTIMNKKPNNI